MSKVNNLPDEELAREKEEFNKNFDEILKRAKYGIGGSKDELPVVVASGYLSKLGEIECYYLNNGQRVFRLSNMTLALRGKFHGKLGNYLANANLRPFLPEKLWPDDNNDRKLKGITLARLGSEIIQTYDSEDFIDICIAFVDLSESGVEMTQVQKEIATRAEQFLKASAKIGIAALIDEATGFQYTRPSDALQVKLQFLLADTLQPWYSTFPDELWQQFGRLTNWKGSLKKRPKYWGKLVNEFIYNYLDRDLAKWLRDNVPPRLTGQKYHQWLNENTRVVTLRNHIWKVIGIMATCKDIDELRIKMKELFSGDLLNPLF